MPLVRKSVLQHLGSRVDTERLPLAPRQPSGYGKASFSTSAAEWIRKGSSPSLSDELLVSGIMQEGLDLFWGAAGSESFSRTDGQKMGSELLSGPGIRCIGMLGKFTDRLHGFWADSKGAGIFIVASGWAKYAPASPIIIGMKDFKIVFHMNGQRDSGLQISIERFQGPDPMYLIEEYSWDAIAPGVFEKYVSLAIRSSYSQVTYTVFRLDTGEAVFPTARTLSLN